MTVHSTSPEPWPTQRISHPRLTSLEMADSLDFVCNLRNFQITKAVLVMIIPPRADGIGSVAINAYFSSYMA